MLFEGMESWLPWLSDEELLTDSLPDSAQVVLVEPRRMRDRAADLLAEEDDLAKALASTWERSSDAAFPRLHAEAERLLGTTTRAAWSIVPTPDSPESPAIRSAGWGPVVGDGAALAQRLRSLLGEQYRVVIAADGTGTAARLASALLDQGLDFPVREAAADGTPPDLTRPGGSIVVAPLHRGCSLPGSLVAVVAESDLTGRRRAHRRPRPRKRDTAGFFEDLKPGDYVVHYQHGVGRYGGMVKRTIGGIERDYLLLEYKGADKLYVPSDQIDAVRQYVGGEAPSLHRLGGADFAKAKARVRSAVREIAQELVVLYQKRLHASRARLPERHAVAARDGGVVPVRRDARPAQGDPRCQGRHGGLPPDGPPRVRRRRFRQDGGRAPRRVQGDPGRQAGGRARADDAARTAARQHLRRPIRGLSDQGRSALPLPHQRPGEEGDRRHRIG